jgi:hypothetical protein
MNYSIFIIIGIFLVSIFASSNLTSAETAAKSTTFEKTTLLKFTNNDSVPIYTVKMWLGKDSGNFKSFKAERGWTGVKTAEGLLTFSSTEPLAPGQSVKFGIKTEIEKPGVNWKTSDSTGNEISIGKVISDQTKPSDDAQKPKDVLAPNWNSASFRIVPESPKTGDEIRIVGDGFPANTELDLLIDNQRLESFQTDNNGKLITRAKIPITIQADRVDLEIVDKQGNKKTNSIRISQALPQDTTGSSSSIKRLQIEKYDSIAEPGQKISFSGTGRPGGSVTITAKNALGVKAYEAVVSIDNQGKWIHETTVPLDALLGTRQVEFSDGIDTITKTLSISVSKTINIDSSKIKYDPGEKFIFNGTARPDQILQIIINDPSGKEIFSDILTVDSTGAVSFEYQTGQNLIEGTYAVFASQEDETEIIRIGLGQLPSPQIIAKFDKLNYASSETAKITIQGQPKTSVSFFIIDPSDKVKTGFPVSIALPVDGQTVYDLNLNGYKSGVYTAVVSYTQSEVKLVFSVGLQQSTSNIVAQTTKTEYLPGDSILILGSSDPNAILSLEMTDPSGKIIKRKDIFSDKEGAFSDGTFRVPSNAEQGIWTIKTKSGAKFSDVKITVSGTLEKKFNIKIDKTTPYRSGELMTITGIGGGKSENVIIEILDSNNVKITELTIGSTKDGGFQTFWPVQSGMVPGKYTIKVMLGRETAETTFDLQ